MADFCSTGWTRRGFIGAAASGTSLAVLSGIGQDQRNPLPDSQKTVTPTPDPNFVDSGEYTGTSHGVHAAWDLDIVSFGGSEDTYKEDVPHSDWLFLESKVILKMTIGTNRFADFGWGADVHQAEADGLDLFLASFFDGNQWERIDSWMTGQAVGWLIKPSEYSLNYLEYAPTTVDGIWKQLRYQASFNDRAELESESMDTVATINAVTMDGGPWIKAVDVDELVTLMIDSA